MKKGSLLLPVLLLGTTFLFGSALIETSLPIPPVQPSAAPLTASQGVEPPLHAAAADAIRRKDFAAARAVIDELRSGAQGQAQLNLILGLYAHACEEIEEAVKLLAPLEGGELNDWRLFVLADSAAAAGMYPLARLSLDRLLSNHQDSPLFPRALARAATLAAEAGDYERATSWIIESRKADIDDEISMQLESLAWDLANQLSDRPAIELAARRLLVYHPLKAAELEVVEVFRQQDGDVQWTSMLSAAELGRRAQSLLHRELPSNAVQVLDEVLAEHRDFEWHVLRGAALIADRQGIKALAELERAAPRTPEESSQTEWHLAFAALEASKARRGRTNLPATEREAMKLRAQQHLRKVAEIDADTGRSRQALSKLFRETADEAPFEETIAILRELHRRDGTDRTGARFLWQQGWKQYSERNFPGAIGIWTELDELYPTNRYARSGRYWSGRAHEELGNIERAQTLYRQIASADSADFYRKYAMERLEGGSLGGLPAPPQPAEPWPVDPALARADLLSRYGLDDLALSELEAVRPDADARATNGLAAVILSRQGKPREAINRLSNTFPRLGTSSQSGLPLEALRLYYPRWYNEIIARHATSQSLSPHLVSAMIRQESAFDAGARSWAGARGLMQLMPATGRELANRLGLRFSNERLSDPSFSIQLGTSYFRQVLSMFDDSEELALAGYNGGPYRIKRLLRAAGGTPEIDSFVEGLSLEETKTYVKRVLLFADSYEQLYGYSS